MMQKRKLLFITVMILLFAIMSTGCANNLVKGISMKDNIVAIAKQKGYDVEESAKGFCISEGEDKFYFTSILSSVKLEKIETQAIFTGDYTVEDNVGNITITVKGRDKLEVTLRDTVVEVNNQGKEMVFHEQVYFVCSPEFTMESIDSKNIVTIRGAADKNYIKITKNFISANELRILYERGIAILDELRNQE